MPERVENLESFLREISRLLYMINQCREVLFRAGFREHLPESVEVAAKRLQEFVEDPFIQYPGQYEEMRVAGLQGAQLQLKLESFDSALSVFDLEGGQRNLEHALDTGATILSSLAGAIPGFGSFAQELVEFLLKELRRRIWKRPW
jgi:hypothetical protein